MNLQQFITAHGWDPTKAMNLLQEHGVVSDNCVTVADVAVKDHAAAIQFLGDYPNSDL